MHTGFNSLEECYGDLASEIHAVETGLSSDPAMNRQLSILDDYALVSNSDAHSPAKLAREATLFAIELSFSGLRRALRRPFPGLLGTVEFFPEEGKYHWDGHRACGIRWSPQQTMRAGEMSGLWAPGYRWRTPPGRGFSRPRGRRTTLYGSSGGTVTSFDQNHCRSKTGR